MKILMLNYEFPPLGGGASPFTKELSTELSKEHYVDVVTMGYKGLKKVEKKGKLTIYRVPCIRSKKESSNGFEMLTYLFSAFFKCLNLVKKNKYDLIHSHFIIPTSIIAYALKKIFNIKYIISSHGSDVPEYNPDRFQLLHKLVFPVWSLVSQNSEYIHTPSNTMKKIILNKKKLNNIIVIPYGVYVKKSKVQKKEKIILYAGRLFERKGVQYLIKASNKLPKDWKIIIAGEGYYKPTLINLAKKIKTKVEFTGWLSKPELHKLYRRSSIFVLPSLEESFGIVLVEGMMYSNAIITSKGTACEEVVGTSGILVQRKNVGELEKALISLTSNKKLLKKYQQKAQKRVETFSWNNIIQNYIKLYKTITRKNYKPNQTTKIKMVPIFQILFLKLPFMKKIYKLFFGARRYNYLFEIIREYKCKKIMEIGVWDGEHALQMINTSKKIHGNKVEYYGFDLFEDLDNQTYLEEVAKKPPKLSYVKKKLEKTGCKINLFKGDTSKTLPKQVSKLPKIDFIFIDGGHSLKTIENDWMYSKKLMTDKTVVIFDDYWNRDDVGCKKIVESIDTSKFRVEILPIQDKFKKDWGILTINFVKVQKNNN